MLAPDLFKQMQINVSDGLPLMNRQDIEQVYCDAMKLILIIIITAYSSRCWAQVSNRVTS